jgi:hypothetical protein
MAESKGGALPKGLRMQCTRAVVSQSASREAGGLEESYSVAAAIEYLIKATVDISSRSRKSIQFVVSKPKTCALVGGLRTG